MVSTVKITAVLLGIPCAEGLKLGVRVIQHQQHFHIKHIPCGTESPSKG